MNDPRDRSAAREADLARHRVVTDAELPLHVGALAVFDRALSRDGIEERVAARIAGIARLSDRSGEDAPWSLRTSAPASDRHRLVDRVATAPPGGTAELAATVGELWSRPLPRDRHPWQLWLVEGLAGGRSALLAKGHRGLVDERGGVELLELLLGPPLAGRPGARPRIAARVAPGRRSLSTALRPPSLAGAFGLARDAAGLLSPTTALARARDAARWLESATFIASSPAPETPVNGVLGRERRVGWVRLSCDVLAGIGEAFAASREEIILAIVADALGRYLEQRRRVTFALELNALVLPSAIPASAPDGPGAMISLPVGALVPEARLAAIRSAVRDPGSGERRARLDRVLDLCLALPAPARAAAAALAFQSVSTLCAEARRPRGRIEIDGRSPAMLVPIVPLPWNVGLAFGWYDGGAGELVVGIAADARLVPDIAPIAEALRAACTEAAASAGVPAIDPERRLAS